MSTVEISLFALNTPTSKIQEMPMTYKNIKTAIKAGLYCMNLGLAQDMFVRVRIPLDINQSLTKKYKEHFIDVRNYNINYV